MAKGWPATTVAGVNINTSPGVAVPQFGTRFAVAAAVGPAGKYCVKVTKAATPASAAIAITPSMTFPVRLNLNFDFCFSYNSHPPLPQTHWVSVTTTDTLVVDHESCSPLWSIRCSPL